MGELEETLKKFAETYGLPARVVYKSDGTGSIWLGETVWQLFDTRDEALEILKRWSDGPPLV